MLRYDYYMIGIDGLTSIDCSDCFCCHKSDLMPINYCNKHKGTLSTPKEYQTKKKFDYTSYLKSINADAAPNFLFDEPVHNFKKGMYLEAVDYLEPNLICPAIVKKVVGKLIKISFIGWDDSFDLWFKYNSPEIYPIGWCTIVIILNYELCVLF